MNYPMIVVEVPHQTSPRVWRCNSVKELIEAAYRAMGDDYIVHPIPDELADQFDEDGGPLTEAAQDAMDRATTIEDEDDAREVLAHDLSGLSLLDSPEDVALELASGHQTHQWVNYIGGVEREAIELGWLKDPDEEKEVD